MIFSFPSRSVQVYRGIPTVFNIEPNMTPWIMVFIQNEHYSGIWLFNGSVFARINKALFFRFEKL